MLRMVNKVILLMFMVTVFSYSGNQTVDLKLDLTFPTATQKIIDNKLIIDLGYLEEGRIYTGGTQIEIGKVTVDISQRKTDEASGCILDEMEFDSVNIEKLLLQNQRIETTDKYYVGKGSNIILTAKDIRILRKEGDISPNEKDLYFVSPECIVEQVMPGIALTRLQYEFKLYADISNAVKLDSVVGAFAQDERGIAISLKDLVSRQIKGSNITLYKRRK